VLRLPIEFFNQRYAGEIGNRVQINDRVAALLSRDLATTALNLMVVVIYALLMLQYDLVLSLVSVATAAINVLVLRHVATRRAVLQPAHAAGPRQADGDRDGRPADDRDPEGRRLGVGPFARWAGHQAKVGQRGPGAPADRLSWAPSSPAPVGQRRPGPRASAVCASSTGTSRWACWWRFSR
jgi:hypothetical protein